MYGDREHFANIAWLSGYDPRFEEVLFIVGSRAEPTMLLVGKEREGYLDVSPLRRSGAIRTERYQTFSPLNQPREASRPIRQILAEEGIGRDALVGCAGWKYFSPAEILDPAHALEIPAYLADTLREMAGVERVVNATDLFMHPEYGLRTYCSADEIAFFEFTNVLASEGMKKMLFGFKEGMVDYEVMRLAGYSGEPLACHQIFVTAKNRTRALSGPVGAPIRRGEPLATNLAYWGSNSCRAGWIAFSAQDYVERFAGPYFAAIGEWFQLLRIGTEGGRLWRLIQERLPFEEYSIYLNPGHPIHLDEAASSPIYPESRIRLHSGMFLQVEVIPSSPVYFSTRVEHGVVMADGDLRARLRQRYTECFARCEQRRAFLGGELGLELPEEVLHRPPPRYAGDPQTSPISPDSVASSWPGAGIRTGEDSAPADRGGGHGGGTSPLPVRPSARAGASTGAAGRLPAHRLPLDGQRAHLDERDRRG